MSMPLSEFEQMIQTHQRMVFSIALRVSGDTGAAEEVAQDVFMELFRTGDRLDGEDHVRFWLRRVAVHRATDALRRKRRQPEAAADEWMDEVHTPGDSGAALPDAVAMRLDELVGSLPEKLRVPVVLRYAEEMSPEEIARLLGQPLATVKSHLQRGLKMLRAKAEITMKEYVRHANA